jgi:AraC-like DNA-binding protein
MIPQKSSARSATVHASVHGLVASERRVVRVPGPALVTTLESAVAHVTCGRVEVTVDRSACFVVPARARVVLRAAAPASRVAVLAFLDPIMRRVERSYRKLGVDQARLRRWTERPSVLPRTLWVHEIVHRYLFERFAMGEHHNTATRFLETEIVKEIYFLFRDRDEGAHRLARERRHSAPVERAIGHIESHLYDTIDVAALSVSAGASASTLLRAFRRDVGSTPGAYWRERRLEEALALLRSGSHSVAEVATRVGYDSPTAFGFAFRRRFDAPPSSFLPKGTARRAP